MFRMVFQQRRKTYDTNIVDDPEIRHKVGSCRKESSKVRGHIGCAEAKEIELQDVEIETPICKTTVKELAGKKLALPRAGSEDDDY